MDCSDSIVLSKSPNRNVSFSNKKMTIKFNPNQRVVLNDYDQFKLKSKTDVIRNFNYMEDVSNITDNNLNKYL